MRTVAIVQARIGSTRLPGKVLRQLQGETVLAHVISRLRRASLLDGVWVATTELPADAQVVDEARRLGAGCFRGSEQDVLSRFTGAAKAASADVIVRVTADCPLFDGALLDEMLERFHTGPQVDYLSNVMSRTYPRGLDAEVFTIDALEKADREAVQPHDREHVTPYIYTHPELFRLGSFTGEVDLSGHRWTLDTTEDWQLIQAIYAGLYPTNPEFATGDVLKLLKAHSELVKLNAHVEQKKL